MQTEMHIVLYSLVIQKQQKKESFQTSFFFWKILFQISCKSNCVESWSHYHDLNQSVSGVDHYTPSCYYRNDKVLEWALELQSELLLQKLQIWALWYNSNHQVAAFRIQTSTNKQKQPWMHGNAADGKAEWRPRRLTVIQLTVRPTHNQTQWFKKRNSTKVKHANNI